MGASCAAAGAGKLSEASARGFIFYPVLSLLVMYLGVRMIIKRILLRRSARRQAEPA